MRCAALLLVFAAALDGASALQWSAWFGGAGGDRGSNPAIDQDGNLWITGRTSGNLPTTPDAAQPKFGGGTCGIPDPRFSLIYDCGDVFIVKLDPTGSKILYATYFGGPGEEYGRQIAADRSGNVYVLGLLQSVTSAPTAFLLKLTTAGKLVWQVPVATDAGSFAVDAGGAIYLAGGNSNDAYVTKLASDGTTVVWTRRFGGGDVDQAALVCVDRSGAVYVTGITRSTDFPVTPQALAPTLTAYGAFAAKIRADGSGLAYATYFPGGITALACDDNGSAYVAGVAVAGFPTTPGAPQAGYREDGRSLPGDAIVAKINATGTALAYATYLGGSAYDLATGVAVDASGVATVAGLTNSTDFPVSSALQRTLRGPSDAFVTRVNAAGTAFVYSTFLGGDGGDLATGVVLDGAGNALVRGCGGAPGCILAPNDLTPGPAPGAPATDNAVSVASGMRGVFLASIAGNATPVPRLYQGTLANLASGALTSAVPGGIVRIAGYAMGPETPVALQVGGDGKVASSLAGVRLLFDGVPAPLLLVSADAIQAVVPFGVAGRQSTQILLETASGRTTPITVPVADADPALLALGTHAAALNEDGTLNSAANPAARGSILVLFAVGLGQTAPPGIDGAVTSGPPATPVLPVAVTVAGQAAEVLFAGAAPGMVAGVTQVNVRLPAIGGLDLPVTISAGSHSAAASPAISVK